jgi:hypothetical protein
MNNTQTVFIPDTSHVVGKTRQEVYEIIKKEYVDTGKYVFATNDIADDLIPKDDNWYFLFGSILRDSGGDAYVPRVYWDDGELHRGSSWLVRDWGGDERVVLLETLSSDSEPLPPADLSLDFAIAKVKEAGYKIFKEM